MIESSSRGQPAPANQVESIKHMHPKAPSRLAHLPMIVSSESLYRPSTLSDESGPIYLIPAVAISTDEYGRAVYDETHPDVKVIGEWTREDCLMHVGAGAKIHYGYHNVMRFTNSEVIEYWSPGERFASDLYPNTVTASEPRNKCGSHASRRTRWGYADGSRNRNSALPTPETHPRLFERNPSQKYEADCAKCLRLDA